MTSLGPDLSIKRLKLGQYSTNCYIILCPLSGRCIIVDPAAEAERILQEVQGLEVNRILLTHAHGDHIGALAEVRRATQAPLGMNHADVPLLGHVPELDLHDGDILTCGQNRIRVIHTPGHTLGSICLLLDGAIIAGDTLFSHGPGHTASPEAFGQIVASITQHLFTLPDETVAYPGHGSETTIGAEKAEYAVFAQRQHDPKLCGDVLWLSA